MNAIKEATPETDAPMLNQEDIHSLILAEESPCVSIYVPTSPVSSYREKNRILYKDQIKKVGETLESSTMDMRCQTRLLEDLKAVGSTDRFWTHQQYGLAVFASSERFMVRRMMRRPDHQRGIVANTFHLRPALRETATWVRYQVLCISLQQVALYEGSREHLSEVELHDDVPRSMADAIGRTEHGSRRRSAERSGDDDNDLKHYFRLVDEAIREHHNGRAGLPLILAAVSEHQGLFREVSRNPELLDQGLEKQPFEELHGHRLGEACWLIVEDAMLAESDQWVERYRDREAHNEGESALDKVTLAAVSGRVDAVLIDDSARVEGSVDRDTGAIQHGVAGDATTDDVLDSIAQLVLHYDGKVRYIPCDQMPSETGVAAILRYALEPE